MEQYKKRIAKNSFMLFFRMGITVIVSLYTSRIVLNELGITDFGIYNVVGGIIALMTFVNGSLTQGVQRYLNLFKAKSDNNSLIKVFSASIIIIILLGLLILIVGESIGLWFVNNYLVIPEDKIYATNWVYQLSLCGCIIGLFQIPYTAAIISNEDMQVYAYISFLEVGMKLIIVMVLCLAPVNKLILYAFLMLLVVVITTSAYAIYARKRYDICRFGFTRDKSIYRDLLSFSGWNVLGTSANLLSVQGMNIVLNLFFGPVVNAARGVAVQVCTQLDNLINNVQVAMNPQLIQLHANGEKEKMQHLLIDNFKWNFFLFWMCGLPILFNTKKILYIWLGEVPEYTVIFTQLVVIRCLLKVFERPLITAAMAYGRMKLPNIASGSFLISEVILAIILFKAGFSPYWAYVVDLFGIALCIFFDIWFLNLKKVFSPITVFKNLWSIPLVIVVSGCIGIILNSYFTDDSNFALFLKIIILMCVIGISVIYVGLNRDQRNMILNKIKSRF